MKLQTEGIIEKIMEKWVRYSERNCEQEKNPISTQNIQIFMILGDQLKTGTNKYWRDVHFSWCWHFFVLFKFLHHDVLKKTEDENVPEKASSSSPVIT